MFLLGACDCGGERPHHLFSELDEFWNDLSGSGETEWREAVRWNYRCVFCGKLFSFVESPERHVLEVHADEKSNEGMQNFTCKTSGNSHSAWYRIMRFRFQGVAHDQWTTVMTKNTSGKAWTSDCCAHLVFCEQHRIFAFQDILTVKDDSMVATVGLRIVKMNGFWGQRFPIRRFLEEINSNNFVDAEHPNLNVLGGRLRDKATRSSQPEKYGKPKTPRENNCDICGKSFLRLSDRRRHATVHTGSKNYKCEFCNKSFAQHTSLKGHKTVAHSSEQASGVDQNSVPVEIGACQQKTEEHSIGVIQYTEASKVLTTVCLSLGYVISECVLLCTNQRNCTGNYPPQKHSLITEMVLIPTADLITQSTKEARPPLSKILAQVQHNSQNGTGQTNNHLPIGQNTNTPLVTNMYRREAQPYTCNLCGKSFLAAAHLRRHAGVNTKSKNYLCDCCTKQFKYESSLKIHKQVAHPDKETEDSVAKH
ncbi:hypothetical protein T265_13527, partial [Opisthorchis viverrini]